MASASALRTHAVTVKWAPQSELLSPFISIFMQVIQAQSVRVKGHTQLTTTEPCAARAPHAGALLSRGVRLVLGFTPGLSRTEWAGPQQHHLLQALQVPALFWQLQSSIFELTPLTFYYHLRGALEESTHKRVCLICHNSLEVPNFRLKTIIKTLCF